MGWGRFLEQARAYSELKGEGEGSGTQGENKSLEPWLRHSAALISSAKRKPGKRVPIVLPHWSYRAQGRGKGESAGWSTDHVWDLGTQRPSKHVLKHHNISNSACPISKHSPHLAILVSSVVPKHRKCPIPQLAYTKREKHGRVSWTVCLSTHTSAAAQQRSDVWSKFKNTIFQYLSSCA